MRNSLYWDDFYKREKETVDAIKSGTTPEIRRVAIFVTNKCNFRCSYCNHPHNKNEMKEGTFDSIVNRHKETAIIHITGGEPSCVKWLYNYIDTHVAKFHLNSNLYIKPPINVRRLKVSLDSCDKEYYDNLVCKKGAFDRVTENIRRACLQTVVSVTCVLTKENYMNAPLLVKFCRENFKGLYAVFFSIYKGENERFIFDEKTAELFINDIRPRLKEEMDEESWALLNETIDEKIRVMQCERFPENNNISKCWLSMSERVYDSNGRMSNCSHLFRDGIYSTDNSIKEKCFYGCNRRLVKFNEDVEKLIKGEKICQNVQDVKTI